MNRTKTGIAPATFHAENFHSLCDYLAGRDPDLRQIVSTYGYPPMWTRDNSFETLVHIILEQQVSLASALAALNQLRERTGSITPEQVIGLSDEVMRACFVSRQKAGYIKGLAQALISGTLELKALKALPDDEVRSRLTQLKGIGNWTADIYLMFVLQRIDIFPLGDLAAVNAAKRVKQLSAPADSKADITAVSEQWKPYRTIATMLLWHYYLSVRQKGAAAH